MADFPCVPGEGRKRTELLIFLAARAAIAISPVVWAPPRQRYDKDISTGRVRRTQEKSTWQPEPPNSQDFLSRSCASREVSRTRHRRDLGSRGLTVPATRLSFSVQSVPHLITLFDGSTFDLADPNYGAVSARNIVHGLSGVYRFAGQSPRRLTVAEHTLMGSSAALFRDLDFRTRDPEPSGAGGSLAHRRNLGRSENDRFRSWSDRAGGRVGDRWADAAGSL